MYSVPVAWDTGYEIGIEDIDFQHHVFLNLINRIAAELVHVENVSYRSALISELNAYALFHFISEENMMARAGYDHLDEHRRHHRELIDRLSSRENMLALKGTPEEGAELIQFLVDWFMYHTTHEDRLFAAFLQGKGHGPL